MFMNIAMFSRLLKIAKVLRFFEVISISFNDFNSSSEFFFIFFRESKCKPGLTNINYYTECLARCVKNAFCLCIDENLTA